MNVIKCQVASIEALTPYVYKVLLKPEQTVNFMPGQYLNFVLSDDDKRPFSIASSPNNDLIELQIGAFSADSYPMQVIEHIKNNKEVTVELPLGSAQLREESTKPLLLIAGGTGFSYIKSMFEYLSQEQSSRKVIVYWGLREPSACYELDESAAIIAKLNEGEFHTVVETPHDDWSGKVGIVHKVVMNDIKNLEDYDIYLAGRFEMVGVVRDDFVARGVNKDNMFADAFAYI
ncbi:NAD(P)H-flavin reductase [Colwellia sp. UCD-KL20]|uniref:NAD(P)H-flavin reductase n=1 Tax=Colwellia sp. UCD-KL20 TaxID=1917165 RepID=UPI00097068A0|nr:NAD(P)H-flavin reductase [Colwellia sp. UCD-KL20]